MNLQVVPLDEVPIEGMERDTDPKPPVILVVDDEPLVADTLSAVLFQAGYRTMTAYDGSTALRLVQAARPALVITDVAMPRMNGVELAISVRTLLRDCGVLLFSGHATGIDLAAAREAGFEFTLLRKPVHPTEMLKHVSRFMTQHPAVKPRRHNAPFLPSMAIAGGA